MKQAVFLLLACLALPLFALDSNEKNQGTTGITRPESRVSLTLRIERQGLEQSKLEVQLWLDVESQHEHRRLATRDVGKGVHEVRFPDLSPGTYLVLLAGSDPLERLSEQIRVECENVEKEIAIEPFVLRGRVTLGEKAQGGGELGISERRQVWRAKLAIDDEGRFGGTLWQHGKLSAWMNTPMIKGILVQSPELGADLSEWNIALPDRFIHGSVYDTATRLPMTQGELSIQVEAAEMTKEERAAKGVTSSMGTLYTSLVIDPDGSYRFPAMNAGTYRFKLALPDTMPMVESVEVREGDGSTKLDFAVTSGVLQVLEAVWPNGSPVANATLIEGLGTDGVNPDFMWRLDASGRIELRGKPGESRTLFVIPNEGSFGIVKFQIGRSDAALTPLRVTIPSPAGSVRIRTADKEGKPVPGRFAVRVNGEMIPFSIGSRMARVWGSTGPGGEARWSGMPAAVFEFWPAAGSDPDLTRPPVRVGFSGGDEVVQLTIP